MPAELEACVQDVLAKDPSLDESNAYAICNAQLGGGSNFVNYTVDSKGDLYLKYFFADSSFARRSPTEGFTLNGGAIAEHDNEVAGLPFSILPSKELSIFGDYHPWHPDVGRATWQDHVDFARKFSPGHLVKLTPYSQLQGAAQDVIKNDGRFAIVKIDDARTRDAYVSNPSLIPKAVSPGFLNLEAPNKTDIKNFRWTHLAAVPQGAYGDKATLYASCIGGDSCVDKLVGASVLEKAKQTNYCPIGASETISSLGNSSTFLQQMSVNANAEPVASIPPANSAAPTAAPPAQTGALTTAAPITPSQTPAIPRLKLTGVTNAQKPTEPQVTDKRIEDMEKKLAVIEEQEQLKQRLNHVRPLIDMRLFTVGGKYNQKEHDAAIEEAAKSGWTDEQITRYYGGLLKIKEFEESQKGNPLGGSYNYQTPSYVPEPTGAGVTELTTAQKTKALFEMFNLGGR